MDGGVLFIKLLSHKSLVVLTLYPFLSKKNRTKLKKRKRYKTRSLNTDTIIHWKGSDIERKATEIEQISMTKMNYKICIEIRKYLKGAIQRKNNKTKHGYDFGLSMKGRTYVLVNL